jgi:hypothetical protein
MDVVTFRQAGPCMNEKPEARIDALVLNRADNIAVCLHDLPASAEILVKSDQDTFVMKTVDAISRGHKVAIQDMPKGEGIIKYAEKIGVLTKDVRKGEHIHIHNISD